MPGRHVADAEFGDVADLQPGEALQPGHGDHLTDEPQRHFAPLLLGAHAQDSRRSPQQGQRGEAIRQGQGLQGADVDAEVGQVGTGQVEVRLAMAVERQVAHQRGVLQEADQIVAPRRQVDLVEGGPGAQ